jgi:hypothetical protein
MLVCPNRILVDLLYFLQIPSISWILLCRFLVSASVIFLPLLWECINDTASGWCCPWMVSIFLVFLSSFCVYSWCQLIIPELYLTTGIFGVPLACILFINRLTCSFSFSLSFLRSILWISLYPNISMLSSTLILEYLCPLCFLCVVL